MATAREHYDRHLGRVYGWMIGDVDRARQAALDELRALGLGHGADRQAADLGCGPGAHALALASCGYRVTAIDTCATLLDELRSRDGAGAITCVNDDLLQLRRYCEGGLDAVLCMGDTLTHLDSRADVGRCLDTVASLLTPDGTFVATFRDYSGPGPVGDARFIPVRQDEGRILTCFLEYNDATVRVHDLLHELTETGWTLAVSSYSKLRLAPRQVEASLTRRGLVATLDIGRHGMVRLVARHRRATAAPQEKAS